MKKGYLIITIITSLLQFLWPNKTIAQYDSIISKLPSSHQQGVVLYPHSNSYIFVIKPLDYTKILLKDIDADMNGRMKIFQLADELYSAQYRKTTTLSEGTFDFFPNTSILCNLFLKHKILVYSIVEKKVIKYKVIKYRKNGSYKVYDNYKNISFFSHCYRFVDNRRNFKR